MAIVTYNITYVSSTYNAYMVPKAQVNNTEVKGLGELI